MGSDILNIPSHWDCKTLLECTSNKNISYGIVQPGQHDENGIGIIRVNNFENGQINTNEVLKVSPAVESKFSKTRLNGGEVLLTLVGSTGQSAVVPKELKGWNVPRAVAVIRPSEEVSAEWINICLQSPHTKHFLDSRANTTVQKTLNLKDVKDIPIPLPPEHERKRLEKTIVDLTTKISLNRQINQTLEQMAQTLFKSWFVDFDPVIDNALDADSPIPDELQQRATQRKAMRANEGFKPLPDNIRQLFPDSFEESELGWVPSGWEVSTTGDELTVKGGSTPSTKNPEFWEGGDIHWTSPKDLSGQNEKVMLDTDRKITAEGLKKITSGLLPVETVLMSSRAPIGYLAIAKIPVSVNQGYIAIPETRRLSQEFILYWLDANLDEIKGVSGGTTFSEISKKTFKSLNIIVPNKSCLDQFSLLVQSYLDKIEQNVNELNSLENLRDTLLPKLISGELRLDQLDIDAGNQENISEETAIA